MARWKGWLKAASMTGVTAGALLLAEPAFAFGGGGFHGGGFHGGGFRGGGFHGGWGGGWRGGGWGGPYWGGAVIAPAWGWGWGWGPDWGWDDGYYAAPVYGAPAYAQCYIRRARVHTRYGWRWRRVRYCYQ